MSTENEKIIAKIKALLSKTTENGCSEQEAIAAFEKASELLKLHNLTMDNVILNGQESILLQIETDDRRRTQAYKTLVAVAKFCDCKVYIDTRKDKIKIVCFFGLEIDVYMCKYLFEMINNSIETCTDAFKKTALYIVNNQSRKTLSTNFQLGMVSRIHERLMEMTKERHVQENTSSAGIVLVKNAKVENDWEKYSESLKLKKPQTVKNKYDEESYLAGQIQGDGVNLNRPLSSQSETKLLG